MVQLTVRDVCHSELPIVAMAEDAHVFVEHDALLPAPVRLEVPVKQGVRFAAVEARGEHGQGRRR
jgi:hypothetical protein